MHDDRPWPGVPARLLLVEDETSIRTMVGRVLARQGFDVRTAPGGNEAQAIVRDGFVPEVLVTDLIMPVMNGAAVAARIRELVPGLPVLFMSGHVDHPLLEQAMAAGQGFLAKPFALGQLRDAIGRVLGVPAPDSEAA